MIRAAAKQEVYNFFRRAVDTLYHGIIPMLFDGDRLAACDECFVAEVDGKIVGAVTIAFEAENGPTLDTLFVLDDQQRKGIGSSLCAKATQRLIEVGKTPIYCEVNSLAMHDTIKRLPEDQQAQFRLNLVYERFGDLEMPNALDYLLKEISPPHDRWGISASQFIAIGQIIVAFQRLTWGLGYVVFILKGERENIAEHVAKAMFLDKLKLFEKLYRERVEDCGDKGLDESFKGAWNACDSANTLRNGIIHAQFGFSPQMEFVIEDLKGKTEGLPIIVSPESEPSELFAIVEQIEQANEKLMDFVRQFLARYLDEYNRGYLRPKCGELPANQ